MGNYLAANGQIVDQVTGRGVDGVLLDFVRVGGIGVTDEHKSVTTTGGGFWSVEFSPSSAGTLFVNVTVAAPTSVPYHINGLALESREHGGDANFNERWVERPYFNRFAEFFLRGTAGDAAQNVVAEFRRTGGAPLTGPGIASGAFTRTTDGGGRFRLFPYVESDSVVAAGDGPAVGDITVHLPPPLGNSVIRGVTVPPAYVYREEALILRYGVGPSLNYYGTVVNKATGAPLKAVSIVFERTGGIPISLTPLTTVSDSVGHFNMPLVRALAAGTVQGRFIFKVAPAAVPETLLVSLPTFDADSAALAPFAIKGP